jgi:hypothetical protein
MVNPKVVGGYLAVMCAGLTSLGIGLAGNSSERAIAAGIAAGFGTAGYFLLRNPESRKAVTYIIVD